MCCNYSHLLSNFASKLQLYMTTFHYKIVRMQNIIIYKKVEIVVLVNLFITGVTRKVTTIS